MANLTTTALAACPDTKIILSGYSQGGMVVHNAASSLASSQITGAVIFGDPFNGQSVDNVDSSKLKEYCATGDEVCSGAHSFTITAAHLTYGDDASGAAQFISNVTGVTA
jgi:cutinase